MRSPSFTAPSACCGLFLITAPRRPFSRDSAYGFDTSAARRAELRIARGHGANSEVERANAYRSALTAQRLVILFAVYSAWEKVVFIGIAVEIGVYQS